MSVTHPLFSPKGSQPATTTGNHLPLATTLQVSTGQDTSHCCSLSPGPGFSEADTHHGCSSSRSCCAQRVPVRSTGWVCCSECCAGVGLHFCGPVLRPRSLLGQIPSASAVCSPACLHTHVLTLTHILPFPHPQGLAQPSTTTELDISSLSF